MSRQQRTPALGRAIAIAGAVCILSAASSAVAVAGQPVQKLSGAGATAAARFGASVAISADGSTALIGAPRDGSSWQGAAFVFTHTASGWVQQGEKLPGGGTSVALSGDGNTALVGAGYAVWIYTRTGSTWSLQQKLQPGPTGSGFGEAVALSEDGNTALIGAPGEAEFEGAAYVYTRTGGAWTQQGEKLTASGKHRHGYFGQTLALSADGDTALVTGAAVAWPFVRSGETWSQGEPLVPSEGGTQAMVPSVSLSGDGTTALLGSPYEGRGVGAAWAFVRSGAGWSQQGGPLSANGEYGRELFAASLALSADGNTALIGAPEGFAGSVWVFTRSAGAWTKQSRLVGTGESPLAELGSSVALSADGTAALIGAYRQLGESPTEYAGEHGAVWAGSPSALTQTPLELGRCLRTRPSKENGKVVYYAHYTTSRCTVPSETENGPYEWFAGATAAKSHFTSAFVYGAHKIVLETVGKARIECADESGSGEYIDARTLGSVALTLKACSGLGGECTSPGAGPGYIVTAPLEGALGWESKALQKAALDLFAASGPVAEFTCGTQSVLVRGSVLVPIATGKLFTSTRLLFTQSKGHQKLEHLEGQTNDVLEMSIGGGAYEQAGLSLAMLQKNEEVLEVNPAA
jgi:hypothetical protein